MGWVKEVAVAVGNLAEQLTCIGTPAAEDLQDDGHNGVTMLCSPCCLLLINSFTLTMYHYLDFTVK